MKAELTTSSVVVDTRYVRWMPCEQVHVPIKDVSNVSMFIAGKVPLELHALPRSGSELQFHEFFNRLWASISSIFAWIHIECIIQACFVDGRGLD